MADNDSGSSLTAQSWLQTPKRRETPRALSALPDVVATRQVGEVEEFEVASKSPKLDKMEVCHYEKLMALCMKQGITPTTLMEGVLIALGDNEAVMAEVINVAKERRRIRAELGKRRRLDTEMKKMGKL
jgi:hypothetical protein